MTYSVNIDLQSESAFSCSITYLILTCSKRDNTIYQRSLEYRIVLKNLSDNKMNWNVVIEIYICPSLAIYTCVRRDLHAWCRFRTKNLGYINGGWRSTRYRSCIKYSNALEGGFFKTELWTRNCLHLQGNCWICDVKDMVTQVIVYRRSPFPIFGDVKSRSARTTHECL